MLHNYERDVVDEEQVDGRVQQLQTVGNKEGEDFRGQTVLLERADSDGGLEPAKFTRSLP